MPFSSSTGLIRVLKLIRKLHPRGFQQLISAFDPELLLMPSVFNEFADAEIVPENCSFPEFINLSEDL